VVSEAPRIPADHWTDAWAASDPSQVSWYQAEPATSLRLVTALAGVSTAIVDVGGGVSVLAKRLLSAGYRDVTVVDVAVAPLERLRSDLVHAGVDVAGLHTTVAGFASWEPDRLFGLWHDRAGYHFLTDETTREHYRNTMAHSIPSGGHAIMAMFGPDGPER
jgi:hypothetical protein